MGISFGAAPSGGVIYFTGNPFCRSGIAIAVAPVPVPIQCRGPTPGGRRQRSLSLLRERTPFRQRSEGVSPASLGCVRRSKADLKSHSGLSRAAELHRDRLRVFSWPQSEPRPSAGPFLSHETSTIFP